MLSMSYLLRCGENAMPRQDNLKEEEKLKKELRLRMAYAGFLQETVTAMAVKKKTRYAEVQQSRRIRCYSRVEYLPPNQYGPPARA